MNEAVGEWFPFNLASSAVEARPGATNAAPTVTHARLRSVDFHRGKETGQPDRAMGSGSA